MSRTITFRNNVRNVLCTHIFLFGLSSLFRILLHRLVSTPILSSVVAELSASHQGLGTSILHAQTMAGKRGPFTPPTRAHVRMIPILAPSTKGAHTSSVLGSSSTLCYIRAESSNEEPSKY
jgi:hypothetical protein